MCVCVCVCVYILMHIYVCACVDILEFKYIFLTLFNLFEIYWKLYELTSLIK